jgi:hypothetical protein
MADEVPPLPPENKPRDLDFEQARLAYSVIAI